MAIARFPNSTPLFDPHRMVVLFAAIVGNQTIACAVSREALEDHFKGSSLTPGAVFSNNRAAIEKVAAKLISMNRFESDGSILVRTEDF